MIDDPFYRTEEFEWMSVKSREYIPNDVLSGVLYDSKMKEDFFTPMHDAMVYEINAKVLGKKLPDFSVKETKTFNMPKNPWQHFKDMYADKWFMRRLVRRWPVKFIKQNLTLTATWEQWATYPWIAKVPATPNWHPVRVVMPAKTKLDIGDLYTE